MYAALTTKNKSFVKRFSHGSRFRYALDLLNPTSEDRILDYGTGDGFMLSMIRSVNDHCKITGYEPMPKMFKELKEKHRDADSHSVELVNSLNGYKGDFNKICCLEVLEHLTEENQEKELRKMMSLLTDDGELIVSVPIEVGFSSLLKNITRILLKQVHGNTSLRNIVYSLLGIRFDRGNESYISSHIGFYYHDLESLILSSGYKIRSKKFSPIPILRGAANSQVFLVIGKS